MLRISNATREDRGEYQVRAINCLGEDTASLLVTITGIFSKCMVYFLIKKFIF